MQHDTLYLQSKDYNWTRNDKKEHSNIKHCIGYDDVVYCL